MLSGFFVVISSMFAFISMRAEDPIDTMLWACLCALWAIYFKKGNK